MLWQEAATPPALVPPGGSTPDEDDVTITAEVFTGGVPGPSGLTLLPTSPTTQTTQEVDDSWGHRPGPSHESQQRTAVTLQHFPVDSSEECPM